LSLGISIGAMFVGILCDNKILLQPDGRGLRDLLGTMRMYRAFCWRRMVRQTYTHLLVLYCDSLGHRNENIAKTINLAISSFGFSRDVCPRSDLNPNQSDILDKK